MLISAAGYFVREKRSVGLESSSSLSRVASS